MTQTPSERIAALVEGALASAPPCDPIPAIAQLRPAIEWPHGYDMTAAGLSHRPKADSPGEWLSDPFDVHAAVRTEEGTGWSIALSFRDPDGRLQTVVVALADLAGGDASEVRREMASKGLRLASGRGAKDGPLAASVRRFTVRT